MEIGYNATYLMEMLKSMSGEKIVMRLGTALGAGVVEPMGGLDRGGRGSALPDHATASPRRGD